MESQTPPCRAVLLLVIFQTLSALITATPITSRYRHTWYSDFTRAESWPSLLATRPHDTFTKVEDNSSLLAQSDMPLSSTFRPILSRCQNTEETLTNTTGTIAVTQMEEFCLETLTRVWNIYLTSLEDGMIVRFNHIQVTDDCRLSTFRFSTRRNILIEDRCWTKHSYDNYRPMLLRDRRLKMLLRLVNYIGGHKKSVCVKFNLTYSARPIWTIPREITVPGSLGFYNCSGTNVSVPSFFRCNWIRECVGNEDEDDCHHTDEGCGDWLPLRHHCLKLQFVVTSKSNKRKRRRVLTSSDMAEQACSMLYGARLAQLTDMEDVHFLSRVIRPAGFRTMTIAAMTVRPVSKRLSHLYRFLVQWGGRSTPIVYRQVQGDRKYKIGCIVIEAIPISTRLVTMGCSQPNPVPDGYVCMKPRFPRTQVPVETSLAVHLLRPSHKISQFPTRRCHDGSLVQLFHRCHHESRQEAMAWSSRSSSLFDCRHGPPVHYTLVCDGNADCPGTIDEADCGLVRFFPLRVSMFECRRFQLVPRAQRCDGKRDCFDDSDEEDCKECANRHHISCPVTGCIPHYYSNYAWLMCSHIIISEKIQQHCHNCSRVVSMDGFGMAPLQPANDLNVRDTFPCRYRDYSIPSFLFNNGELDCKYGEDENIPMANFTCPGFYRCRDSYSCVHPAHVCDGIHHCPYKDDERYCNLVCPEGCLCEGHAFVCKQFCNFTDMLQARSVDFSGSVNLSLAKIHFLELLQFLNLSHCGLKTVTIPSMPQLRSLDFSYNTCENLSLPLLILFPHLKYLDISHNPFVNVLQSLFGSVMKESASRNLQSLIMKHTHLNSITDTSLSHFPNLKVLDIRDNSIENYDKHIFWGLDSLQQLNTDDSKLCCSYFHSSDTIDCVAPYDELSSCNDLLRLNFFRVFLWLISLLAILGNTNAVLYRLFGGKQRTFSAFRVLVSNLCAADLIMGIYMMMIGIADAQLKNQYVAKEKVWKKSLLCKAAGFLGFVSSEASALTICLITLDRVLVLCFPLKSQLHLGVCSSLAACGVVWIVAVILAALPLLAGLQFYGVSSICLPLPITRHKFSGQFYSSGVFIVFNFVIFVAIGIGQILVYCAILRARKSVGTRPTRNSQEMTIARRLFLVIFSDFCCWFPIGLLGILVANNLQVSTEVNIWAAIFILPLNSALNPLLYTLNNFLDKRASEKIKKQARGILANPQSQLSKMPQSFIEDLLMICVRSKVVKREKIFQIFQSQQNDTVPCSSVS